MDFFESRANKKARNSFQMTPGNKIIGKNAGNEYHQSIPSKRQVLLYRQGIQIARQQETLMTESSDYDKSAVQLSHSI